MYLCFFSLYIYVYIIYIYFVVLKANLYPYSLEVMFFGSVCMHIIVSVNMIG